MGTYLVTGGAGFIGSHLCDALLDAGHAVRVIDDLSSGRRDNLPPGVDLVVADINDAPMVRTAAEGIDGCFHLAAVASVERCNGAWLDTHDVNQRGTIAVLNTAREGGFPVVYASSAAVYGETDGSPVAETHPTIPLTAYGADKLGSELHARIAGTVHGVRSYGLRFFNVYGPRQDPASPYSGVVSIFADRLARDADVTIHGDGGQSRDFVYVADVVRGLLAAMERADTSGPVCNVCTGRSTTVLDLARILTTLTASTSRIHHGEARVGDIRHSLGDARRLRDHLGVSARTPLGDGLAALLDETRPRPQRLARPAE